MKHLLRLASLLLITCACVKAQPVIGEKEPLVNASINAAGELTITAAEKSSSHDFDFLKGRWRVDNKRLKTRLNNSAEWIEFKSTVNNRTLLKGIANLDVARTSHTGTPYETVSLRLFNPQTRLWSCYWVDGKTGMMDPVVVGSFEGDIGTFYGKNNHNGTPVTVMFRWNKTNREKPEWSQAYSADHGKTWEWNSYNVSHPDTAHTPVKPIADTFLPDIVSTDSTEFNAAFSADGNSFYFSRVINRKTRIFMTTKNAKGWSAPTPVPFSSEKFSDADPAFSPHGELYFISNRPANINDTTQDYDIWKVTPLSNRQWSAPINVTALNSPRDEFYISFSKNGDAYFSSSREGGYGEEDIYYSPYKNNTFGAAQNVGDQINSAYSEYDPWITPAGTGLIFTSSGRSDSFGKGDLYWSVKSNHVWAGTKHFDSNINTPTRDYCPYTTADTKYFFYSTNGDIKYISTIHLPEALQRSINK